MARLDNKRLHREGEPERTEDELIAAYKAGERHLAMYQFEYRGYDIQFLNAVSDAPADLKKKQDAARMPKTLKKTGSATRASLWRADNKMYLGETQLRSGIRKDKYRNTRGCPIIMT